MSISDNMPHTCIAKRRTRSNDELGGTKDTYTTIFSGRSCWIQAASDTDIVEFQKRDMVITNKVYFVTDPGIDERDILVINGENYEVRSFANLDATVGMGLFFKVMVELKRT